MMTLLLLLLLQLFNCATGEVSPSIEAPSSYTTHPEDLCLSNRGIAASVSVPVVEQTLPKWERGRVVHILNTKTGACKELEGVGGSLVSTSWSNSCPSYIIEV